MDADTESRLTELETRLAHHERMAEEMSAVLFEQGRTIDLMTAQMRRLRDRVAELESGMPRAPQDEPPPPHY
ncbi:SlyX protein [Azospirillum formosense]|uniref:Protein SlyX homolog n=1 Tax=Azospirillum formosense TaxID=861533 RepID=A0ABX2KWK6_9PROT|nr:SlyX family protein [Azospirillum formosense]MBY3754800.1 SlyX family protein [Azospirillum formosense]NUB20946.1 SlyX protein [Azospirillum formosense]